MKKARDYPGFFIKLFLPQCETLRFTKSIPHFSLRIYFVISNRFGCFYVVVVIQYVIQNDISIFAALVTKVSIQQIMASAVNCCSKSTLPICRRKANIQYFLLRRFITCFCKFKNIISVSSIMPRVDYILSRTDECIVHTCSFQIINITDTASLTLTG